MNSVDRVLKVALDEVGYLEKSKTAYLQNPNVLYDKTAGAGNDNYTKYSKDLHEIYPSVMDFPAKWCDAFADWCFFKAYGVSTAKSLLHGNFDDYTVNSCRMYANHDALDTKPKVGDQVFFTKNGNTSGCYHTGIVYKVDDTNFYTIEGNTSNKTEVIPNGGCVAKKQYRISEYKGKVLFGHPKYDVELLSIDEVAKEVLAGKWGNGSDRRTRLANAGYDVGKVQARVNELLMNKKSVDELAKEVLAGKWGVGSERKRKLTEAGYDYAAVQNKVNQMLKPQNKVEDIPLYVWNTLYAEIKNPYGVAGMMGNLHAESKLKPDNMQNSFEKKLGFTDETYTVAVDTGAYGNFGIDKVGYGIAQWSSDGRKQGLYAFAKQRNVSISDVKMQMEYLIKELNTSYKSTLTVLKTATSVKEASDIVLTKFERPRDQSDAVKNLRASYGEEYYKRYGEKA